MTFFFLEKRLISIFCLRNQGCRLQILWDEGLFSSDWWNCISTLDHLESGNLNCPHAAQGPRSCIEFNGIVGFPSYPSPTLLPFKCPSKHRENTIQEVSQVLVDDYWHHQTLPSSINVCLKSNMCQILLGAEGDKDEWIWSEGKVMRKIYE